MLAFEFAIGGDTQHSRCGFFGSPGSTLSHNVGLWGVADASARGGRERSSHCWLTLLSTGTSECDLISCAADADALEEIDVDLHPELAIKKI